MMATETKRKRIAAVVTTYFTNSHADVIVGKFLRGFPTDDGLLAAEVDIVSLYMDQLSAADVGVALARRHGVRICSSIQEALCLDEGTLAVDGVLSIGEHGVYASNELGQHVYPRRHFLDQITAIIAASGRVVPVYSDKHLAHTWEDALHIYQRTSSLGIPFMAGSSVPLFWRSPALEPPVGQALETALVVSYGGVEAYGYHGLELLQSFVERRPGGETGLRSVQCLEGEAVWEAADEGRWDTGLGDACVGVVDLSEAGDDARGSAEGLKLRDACPDAALFLLEYTGKSRAICLRLMECDRWLMCFQMGFARRYCTPGELVGSSTAGRTRPSFRAVRSRPRGCSQQVLQRPREGCPMAGARRSRTFPIYL